MFLIGIAVSLILIGLGIYVGVKNRCAELDAPLVMVRVLLLVISMLGILANAVPLARAHILDDLIAMHTEENERIEESIAELIVAYKEHERDTFVELTQESPIVLVQLYPELRASELVEGQVQLHARNATRIRELREAKIRLSVNRWWIYFGR